MQDISIEFHKEAELEMLQAADFYEHQERGLEQRFFDEIDRGLEAISFTLRDGQFWKAL